MPRRAAVPAERTPRPRPLLGWDVAFTAIIVIMAVVGAWDSLPGGGPELVSLLGILLVLAIVYVWPGRAALRRTVLNEPAKPLDLVFLGTTLVLIGIATALTPDYATLQAIGYPMIWTIVARYRTAVIWNVALAALVGVGCALSFTRYGLDGALWLAGGIGFLSLAFALVMGTWMTRIFAQGERYRVLAEQLRAAHSEVAALSSVAGAAAEREQLSRELHDTLTQTLTGLVMLSEQAGRALDAGEHDRARERCARVEQAARAAAGEARALVASTHPLGDSALEQAIERVAETLSRDFGLRVTCSLGGLDGLDRPDGPNGGSAPLERDLEVVLLRAAQEGLSNVRRHARAEAVWVSLREQSGEADERNNSVTLTIEDDGVGPGPAGSAMRPAPGQGFGLAGLHDRVRLVGGEVKFGPRAGGGSTLRVSVPARGNTDGAGHD